jgi:hypothetical protein
MDVLDVTSRVQPMELDGAAFEDDFWLPSTLIDLEDGF